MTALPQPGTLEGTKHFFQPARPLRDTAATKRVRIVHISDTHGQDYDHIPLGDILIHTGDFTNQGKPEEALKFAKYLGRMKHPHKIVIGGNHEYGWDQLTNPDLQELVSTGYLNKGAPVIAGSNVYFLHESSCVVRGIKFYGAAWNNSSQAWGAHSNDRATFWERIPSDTDVLLTHVPPLSILDLAWVKKSDDAPCSICNGKVHGSYKHWGCEPLTKKSQELRVPVHCFGHVHDETGLKLIGQTTYSNAAMDIFGKCSVIDVLVTDDTICDPIPPTTTILKQNQQSLPAAPASPKKDEGGHSFSDLTLPLAAAFLYPTLGEGNVVLDLDSQDPDRRTLMTWRPSKKNPNQLWSIVPVSRDIDTDDHNSSVRIGSLWTYRSPTVDRFLLYSGSSTVLCGDAPENELASHFVLQPIAQTKAGLVVRLRPKADLSKSICFDRQGLRFATPADVERGGDGWTIVAHAA